MHIDSKKFKVIVPGKLNAVDATSDFNFALRQWKKNQKDSGIIQELFDRKSYTKPSEVRRIQVKNARYKESKNAKTE